MKHHPHRKTYNLLAGFILWILQSISWQVIWNYFYSKNILFPFDRSGNWAVIAIYSILLFVFTKLYHGFKLDQYKITALIISNLIAVGFTNAFTYIQTCLVAHHLLNPKPFAILLLIQIIIIIIWSFLSSNLYYKIFPPFEMLLVYDKDDSARELIYKMMERSKKYKINESIDTKKNPIDIVYDRIKCYRNIVLCDISSEQRNKLLKFCFTNSVRVYITPKISDIIIRYSEELYQFDTPLFVHDAEVMTMTERALKRAMDIIISVVGLVLLSPIMLITALVIKLYDKGPVFFTQTRCTIDNKKFDVIKFRSMIVKAEKDGKPQPAVDNDPRITPIGRFIRKTRIDELPQFFNVLKGEMSIVGPRPERIEHVESYTKQIPEFALRSKVKAGLTGTAQIMGKYNTSPYDKLKMDLMYIANYSLLEDIRLIFMTIRIIFTPESTEGFKKNYTDKNKKG